MSERDELRAAALKWCKENDGGRLHAKGGGANQLCVSWDHGGYHEIAGMYSQSGKAQQDLELICDVFNWALDQLAPSSQSFYGERTYEEDEAL